MNTITIKDNEVRLLKNSFDNLNELWIALQERFPIDLYEVEESALSESEKLAYQKHKVSDKSSYKNFQA